MSWPPASSKTLDIRWPRSIYPFAAPENVSTERPLLALTQLGLAYEDLTFTIRNHDGIHLVYFYLDKSESGLVANVSREIITVAAGGEGKFEVHNAMSLFYGISAAGDPDSGSPVTSVSWAVAGRPRS